MSNKEKILVTGASGFVGSAVARKLVEAGFSVRALVRGTSPRAHLAGLGLDFFEGDLRDRKSVERAIAGMRYAFHVAADYRLWARDPSEIFASNVEGTRNLMEEAMRAGVERVIYTSSVATIALRSDGMAADETSPLREDQGIGVTSAARSRPNDWSRPWWRNEVSPPSSLIPRRRLARAMCGPRRRAGSLSKPPRAAFRHSSTPGSTSCMWTTWPAAISRRCVTGRSASATFSAGRMSCSRRCCAISPPWSVAARRGCGFRGVHLFRLQLSPKPWPTSRDASLLRHWTGFEWRSTACSSHRPKPSKN